MQYFFLFFMVPIYTFGMQNSAFPHLPVCVPVCYVYFFSIFPDLYTLFSNLLPISRQFVKKLTIQSLTLTHYSNTYSYSYQVPGSFESGHTSNLNKSWFWKFESPRKRKHVIHVSNTRHIPIA